MSQEGGITSNGTNETCWAVRRGNSPGRGVEVTVERRLGKYRLE